MDSGVIRGLYRDITDCAHLTPGWIQGFAEFFTEAGILLFGGLLLLAWWRAPGGDSRATAVALLAPWRPWPDISSARP
ncbi:hypothetical protein ACFVIM_02080 [Streptomyces sp. NPDC057638]|uniref:hypothetical protein n=1 Tax=Streptomyces sp. NPDC057638 TaxID=3346190 RepID=UPI00367BF939